MQDLEELRKEIERGGVLHGHEAIDLIDRLQAAEKECDGWMRLCERVQKGETKAMLEAMRLRAEFKALREQKPVSTIDLTAEYKSFCDWCSDKNNAHMHLDPRLHTHSGQISEGGYIDQSLANTAFKAWKSRAKLCAQSRDSAEPVFWYRPTSSGGYEGPIHNSSIDAVRKDSGVWKPLFDHSAHPLATVEAKQSEPLAWKSKTEAYTPYITDSRYQKLAPAFRQWYEPIVEAKQAAPNGWKLVPIEMDDKMQAAAMKVLDDSIGNYASSRARDCYAAMLAAAPQPESAAPEQDDWKSKAAAWLRAKADAQEKKNIAYPEHAKCYPSWVKRVRDLRWDAEELDGVMGSYGAPADEDLSEDDADSDSILAEIAGTTNRTATWKQFSEYLQRLARSAISCKQSPAPKAHGDDFLNAVKDLLSNQKSVSNIAFNLGQDHKDWSRNIWPSIKALDESAGAVSRAIAEGGK